MKFDSARPYPPDPFDALPAVPSFTVTSKDFADGEPLPAAQTGPSRNVSPQLSWAGFPDATKSFLVTAYDPDAPRGGAWHWLVGDIPATVTALPAGRRRGAIRVIASAIIPARRPSTGVPGSVDLRTSVGATGFVGALPPRGDHAHRYFFAVHALDIERLDLPARAKPDAVLAQAAPHTIARAVLVGTHQR
ncbi:MAG: YbhB/YbcL family Raf kinase inhibitor-like protein [Actinomycetia bacterium]|nr:YbhB/YbcL family Raf kinase inhibitor-like protein [Actinomycetes bacterium]